jgi:hypothetical protein
MKTIIILACVFISFSAHAQYTQIPPLQFYPLQMPNRTIAPAYPPNYIIQNSKGTSYAFPDNNGGYIVLNPHGNTTYVSPY